MSLVSVTAADEVEVNRTTTTPPSACDSGNKSVGSLTYIFYRTVLDVYVVSALCVAGVVGNLLSMVVLRRDRDRPNATNWLLQALAVVDTVYLLASVLIQPVKTVNDVGDPEGARAVLRQVFPYVEPHAWALASTAQTATVWLVLLVTVDRYVAVCQPLKVCLVSPTHASRINHFYRATPIQHTNSAVYAIWPGKFAIKNPPHLSCVATLPCKMSSVLKATIENKTTSATTHFK